MKSWHGWVFKPSVRKSSLLHLAGASASRSGGSTIRWQHKQVAVAHWVKGTSGAGRHQHIKKEGVPFNHGGRSKWLYGYKRQPIEATIKLINACQIIEEPQIIMRIGDVDSLCLTTPRCREILELQAPTHTCRYLQQVVLDTQGLGSQTGHESIVWLYMFGYVWLIASYCPARPNSRFLFSGACGQST